MKRSSPFQTPKTFKKRIIETLDARPKAIATDFVPSVFTSQMDSYIGRISRNLDRYDSRMLEPFCEREDGHHAIANVNSQSQMTPNVFTDLGRLSIRKAMERLIRDDKVLQGNTVEAQGADFMAGMLEEITVNVLEAAAFKAQQEHAVGFGATDEICIQQRHVQDAIHSDECLTKLEQNLMFALHPPVEIFSKKQLSRISKKHEHKFPSYAEIISYFVGDLPMLSSLGCVSKQFYHFTEHQELWLPIYLRSCMLNCDLPKSADCFRRALSEEETVRVERERWMIVHHPCVEEFSRQMKIERSRVVEEVRDYSLQFLIRLNPVYKFYDCFGPNACSPLDFDTISALQQLIDHFGARCGSFNAKDIIGESKLMTPVESREGIVDTFSVTDKLDRTPVYDEWKEDLKLMVARMLQIEAGHSMVKMPLSTGCIDNGKSGISSRWLILGHHAAILERMD